MRPSTVAYIEAALFLLIGLLTPIGDRLTGEQPITTRSVVTMIVFGLIGGANSLKAFLSQSSGQIRNPPTELKAAPETKDPV